LALTINGHCGPKTTIFEIKGAGSFAINGIYESYGRSDNTAKYEKILDNGTIFRIHRFQGSQHEWVILNSYQTILYYAPTSKKVPLTGWITFHGSNPAPTLEKYVIQKTKKNTKKVSYESWDNESEVDELGEQTIKSYDPDGDEKLLKKILHPSVGAGLGKYLHSEYTSGFPYDSIVIDGLLQEDILKKCLSYEDIPLSDWEGPEEGTFCCKGKYRLNFNDWRTNKWSRALQTLVSHPNFISFLEHLTGIFGLTPVKVSDSRFIQLGSSMIAISPGGFLHVHNDVRMIKNLLYIIFVTICITLTSTKMVHKVPILIRTSSKKSIS